MEKPTQIVRLPVLWACLALCLHLCSCTYSPPDLTAWDMTAHEKDSLSFLYHHHYTYDSNFIVTADSAVLHPNTLTADSVVVYKGDRLVVADIARDTTQNAADTVNLKVARDQETIGWIPEQEFLRGSVPADPISQAIHFFSDRHTYYFAIILAVAILILVCRRAMRKKVSFIHIYAVNSLYPTLLPMLIAGAAAVYSGIQCFTPDTWATFYYNPTLNPFKTPPVLSLFLCCVWGLVVLSLTVADETFRQLKFADAVSYLLTLAGVCVVVYMFFSVTCLYYIGFVVLPVYYVLAITYYIRYCSHSYVCGNCGKLMRHKGICPYCGAYNE